MHQIDFQKQRNTVKQKANEATIKGKNNSESKEKRITFSVTGINMLNFYKFIFKSYFYTTCHFLKECLQIQNRYGIKSASLSVLPLFKHLSKQTWSESFILNSTHSKTGSRGLFHSKRSMNETRYISHAIDCFFSFPLKYYLFGICYMKGKKRDLLY